jgi:hypothetical protein
LGGGDAPPELGADLLRLRSLPAEALQGIWRVLTPSMAETITPETESLLDDFCAAHAIDEDDLARAVKGCRFLIREAAQRELTADALAEDLERLCPDEPLVKELVLAGYEPARKQIRQEMIRAAVSNHGKMLVGVGWRVDAILASEGGAKLRTPVAMLTLQYREGAETGQVTLQALPDMIEELSEVCKKVLRAGG